MTNDELIERAEKDAARCPKSEPYSDLITRATLLQAEATFRLEAAVLRVFAELHAYRTRP